jgi:hypothetical protein
LCFVVFCFCLAKSGFEGVAAVSVGLNVCECWMYGNTFVECVLFMYECFYVLSYPRFPYIVPMLGFWYRFVWCYCVL